MASPHLIAITGASGAGKTALAYSLSNCLSSNAPVVLSFDAYYRSRSDIAGRTRAILNFDSPDAIDLKLLSDHLHQLAAGYPIDRPVYDFHTHLRTTRTERVVPGEIIIAEGLLALHWPAIRALFGTRVFIIADDKTCLARRLARDVSERGRSEASVRRQWETSVRPMFQRYVEPTRRYADILVNGTKPVDVLTNVVLLQIERVIPKGHVRS